MDQASRVQEQAAVVAGPAATSASLTPVDDVPVSPVPLARSRRPRPFSAIGENAGSPPADPLGNLTIRRKITYDPQGVQPYMRSREALRERLVSAFRAVDPTVIDTLISDVEKLPAKWSPADAFKGISDRLRRDYAPESTPYAGSTTIDQGEARNYFVSNFKTFVEVVIDGTQAFKFTNITDEDLHAEDSFMQEIEKLILQKGWHEDFTGNHTILFRINNSPCVRCATRLYDWDFRDLFVDFDIHFANMYEKGANFNSATTKLRSGGVTMSLMSVTTSLSHLLSVDEMSARKPKDQREALDWAGWLKDHPDSSISGADADMKY